MLEAEEKINEQLLIVRIINLQKVSKTRYSLNPSVSLTTEDKRTGNMAIIEIMRYSPLVCATADQPVSFT